MDLDGIELGFGWIKVGFSAIGRVSLGGLLNLV